jgi:hypothetical protein
MNGWERYDVEAATALLDGKPVAPILRRMEAALRRALAVPVCPRCGGQPDDPDGDDAFCVECDYLFPLRDLED